MRVLLVIVGILAMPLFAEGPGEEPKAGSKAPWEWTFEERLAVRFDPEMVSRRVAGEGMSGESGRTVRGALSGDQTPELFLPIELFAHLLSGVEGDTSFRTAFRAALKERIIKFGFDDQEFWADLERTIAGHVTLVRRHDVLVRKQFETTDVDARSKAEIVAETESVNRGLCASRAGALAKARQQFGIQDFDRFLYTVVAPGLTITPVTPDSMTPSQLRFVAGGCQ